MSERGKPQFQALWKIEDQLREAVREIFPAKLTLDGETPAEWPAGIGGLDDPTFVKAVQDGVAYYCVEDLLWPDGKQKPPNQNLFFRKFCIGELIGFADGGELGLDRVLLPDRHPGRQPVSLRSYDDALRYYEVGRRRAELFQFITHRWALRADIGDRYDDATGGIPDLDLGTLGLVGDPPSKIEERRLPELRFVVGDGVKDLTVPPSSDREHAFRRQVNLLLERWKAEASDNRKRPPARWLRASLNECVDEGFVRTYSRAMSDALALQVDA
ncbi:hypothetical protein [Pseudooceanicola sp. 200-1SW]|uniref:hypothetical protein n=1 Tax=Pseudooceanicola sp. 200-1SW TaxID=3425949 RepID=UPI003D7FFC70